MKQGADGDSADSHEWRGFTPAESEAIQEFLREEKRITDHAAATTAAPGDSAMWTAIRDHVTSLVALDVKSAMSWPAEREIYWEDGHPTPYEKALMELAAIMVRNVQSALAASDGTIGPLNVQP